MVVLLFALFYQSNLRAILTQRVYTPEINTDTDAAIYARKILLPEEDRPGFNAAAFASFYENSLFKEHLTYEEFMEKVNMLLIA